jgi:hypothetical protein
MGIEHGALDHQMLRDLATTVVELTPDLAKAFAITFTERAHLKITIELSPEMYAELERACAIAPGVSATNWAAQAVEAVLATRRLPSVKPGPHGPEARAIEPRSLYRSRSIECRGGG